MVLLATLLICHDMRKFPEGSSHHDLKVFSQTRDVIQIGDHLIRPGAQSATIHQAYQSPAENLL